jgi:ornithine cyclodeaminase/alanine dehydrogenase-like protein (mu-crystallin family)
MMDDSILYLSRAQVEAACQTVDATAAVRDALRSHATGLTRLPEEAYLSWCNGSGDTVRNLNMPGYIDGALRAAGTKIINANPRNIERALPRASGLTLLFDVETTRVTCVMDASYISALRTATVTMLCAELFQGGDIESVALIGAGAIAAAHLRIFPKHLPKLRKLRLYDHSPEAAKRLVSQTREFCAANGIAVEICGSPEQAIRHADLVVPVTTTTSGYIPFEWLKRGALLVHISLDDALPDVVRNADLLIVDDWPLVKADPRRLLGRMYRAGELIGPDDAEKDGARKVDGTIGDVIIGRHPGRSDPAQVVLVNPFGLAIEDVALASQVYAVALKAGIGVALPR